MRSVLTLAIVTMTGMHAQEVRVNQEFQRIGPTGEIVKPDSADPRVEVLSPNLLRGGFSSFHVSIEVPPGTDYELHIAQNPDDRVRATIYREALARHGEEWIPDNLEKLELPVKTKFQPTDGRKVDLYWLDLWVGPDTPVERIRVEVQLSAGGRWIIYPMEPNVSRAVTPSSLARKFAGMPLKLPPPTAPASSVATAAVNAAVCAQKPEGSSIGQTVNVRTLIVRNAMQDAALYKSLAPAVPWDCAVGHQPGRYQKFRRELWKAEATVKEPAPVKGKSETPAKKNQP